MPLPSGLTYNTGLTWTLSNITQDSTFPENFLSDVTGSGYNHVGLSSILNDPNDYNGVAPNKFLYVKFDNAVTYAFAGMTQDRTDTAAVSYHPSGEWLSKVSVGFKADSDLQTDDGKKGVILIVNGTQSVNDGLVLLGSVEDEYVIVQRSAYFDVYVNASLFATFTMPLINGTPYKLMMAFYGDQETLTIKGGAYTGEAPTYGVPTNPKIGVTSLPKSAPTDSGSSVVQVDITPPTTDNNSQITMYILNVTGPSSFSQDIDVAFGSSNYMFSTEANSYAYGDYSFKLKAVTDNGDSTFSQLKTVTVYPQPIATIMPFLGEDDQIYMIIPYVLSLNPVSTTDGVTLRITLRTDPPIDVYSFEYSTTGLFQTSGLAMNENYYMYVGENPNPVLFTTQEDYQLTVTKTINTTSVQYDYSGFLYTVNGLPSPTNTHTFQVYNESKQPVGSPQQTTYTITGLTRDTYYTYSVGFKSIVNGLNIKSYTNVDASFTTANGTVWLPNYTWVAGSYPIGTGVVYNGVAYVTTAIVSDIYTPPDQNTAEWTTTTLPSGYTGGGGGGGGSGGNNGGTGYNNMSSLTYNLPKTANLTYDESVEIYGETAVTRPDYTDTLAVSVPLADLNKVLSFTKDGEAAASAFNVDLSTIADAVKSALVARLVQDHSLPALSTMGIDARSILSHTEGEWIAGDGTLKTADKTDTARNVYEQAADKGKLSASAGELNLAVGDMFVFYLDSSAIQSLTISIDTSTLSGASASDVAPLIPFASIFGASNAAGDKGVISNTWNYKFTVTVTAA